MTVTAPTLRTHTTTTTTALSVQPLLDYMASAQDLTVRIPRNGNIIKAISRARNSGYISHYLADTIAITIFGVHPCVIWGNDWFANAEHE